MSQGFGVFYNLPAIFFKERLLGFIKALANGGCLIIMRSALKSGENRLINGVANVNDVMLGNRRLAISENKRSSWSAKRFMRSGHYNISVKKRRRVSFGDYQTRKMTDVRDQ